MSNLSFRLVLWDTQDPDRYMADDKYEFFGDRESIFFLWITLYKRGGKPHVEIFNLDGDKMYPENDINALWE